MTKGELVDAVLAERIERLERAVLEINGILILTNRLVDYTWAKEWDKLREIADELRAMSRSQGSPSRDRRRRANKQWRCTSQTAGD